MAKNAYGVEITDEIRAEGEAIVRAIEAERLKFYAWVEGVGAAGSGHAESSLADAVEDVAMDVGRFTDTD